MTSGLGAMGGSLATSSPLGQVPGALGSTVRSGLAGAFGGLGARLTGDKFANGFVTGAFAHMWNAERANPIRQLQTWMRKALCDLNGQNACYAAYTQRLS